MQGCCVVRGMLMQKPKVIRILLAEKQAISRSGLRRLLEREPDMNVVAESADAKQASKLALELKPDVILLDLALCTAVTWLPDTVHRPDSSGALAMIMLASASEKTGLLKAFHMGARGAVVRELAGEVLIKAIRSVTKGRYWAASHEAKNLAAAVRALDEPFAQAPPPKTFGLTPRELEVVAAIVACYSNQEIAARMKISEATVKHHVTNIYDKVGVYNRLELALFAIHHGLPAAAGRIGKKQSVS
jgi:two-component system, NarL family, nitrate/nitrite response regulator NarL